MICLVAADHPGFVVDSFSQGEMLAIMRRVTVVERKKRDDVCPGSPYFEGKHNYNSCWKSPKDRSSSSSSSSGSASASGSSSKTLSRSALDNH